MSSSPLPWDFTCLLPVHPQADPDLFRAAARSIAANTLQPAEVIVCQDGTPAAALHAAIVESGFRVIASSGPAGLHHALNSGLDRVRTPWVCRADADDLNRSDRFERQVRVLVDRPDLDVLGGAIEERVEGRRRRVKSAPTSHAEILARARWRNPMHHMTVFFRLDAVRQVGGYPAVPHKEDYALWLRLISAGRRFANLPDVLVEARCHGLARRRAGLHNLASELALWRQRRRGPPALAIGATAAHAARAVVLSFPPAAALAYAGLRRR